MNLEHTEGKITFVESSDVDIESIAKAVVNAGFSVRYLTANYLFQNISVKSGYCYTDAKNILKFILVPDKQLLGETEIKFIGAEFLSRSEYKKFRSLLTSGCDNKDKVAYFVTL